MIDTEFISGWLLDSSHAALLTSQVNRRYITGFKSSYGVVVITKDRDYFLTDSRYYERAAEIISELSDSHGRLHPIKVVLVDEIAEHGLKQQLEYIFVKHRIETVSLENQAMTIAGLERYKKMFPQVEFDTSERLSELLVKKRTVKTLDEIKKIEAAQRIAERAFGKLHSKLKTGMSEKQIAAILNYYMLELGADGIAFDTIVASGKNSAVPHATPTDKPLEQGDFVIIDFGAVVDGYHSDMTRTLVIGKPSETMKRVYDAVWSANTDALKAVRADITGKLLDNVARSTLEAWGYDSFFKHSLGHGVGLEVHEKPTLSIKAKKDSTLREGMVVTIEPGVYIPGKFGVRIEDMVVVTKNGCVNLTKTPKTLLHI
ncbi:MAG: aminopeptidase P family protein [Oscillospiraceae bacterium]|nr:aminopeptidase P family protein [Oscillospiraceae bacterium]